MKRILIIDDNPLNNRNYTEPVEKKFQVEVVMSLLAVKRKLQIRYYDLIVLDVMMPTQDLGGENEIFTGFYFYDNFIKQSYPCIPVLFWSNLPSETFENHFSLSKPQNVSFIQKNKKNKNHLLEKVNEILK